MRHHNGNVERFSKTVFQECQNLSLQALWIRASEGGRRDFWMGLSAVAPSCALSQMWKNNNACPIINSLCLSASYIAELVGLKHI